MGKIIKLLSARQKQRNNRQKGKLTVIAGPMFSGKTGKLVAISEVLTRMGYKVLTVKPAIDQRFGGKDEIHSHDHRRLKAVVVDGDGPEEIVGKIMEQGAQAVIFDEVQFFHKEKVMEVIRKLKQAGLHVIAAGLLYDFRRKPFGATPDLLGLADERLELFAICQKCGSLARHSERVKGTTSRVDVGAANKYIAVCERCHKIYK